MIEVKTYDLPDYNLFNSTKPFEAFVWQPDKIYLVLGQSNNAQTSLFTDIVEKDQIDVYKRPSGGETVILSPKMLVVAVILTEEKLQNPKIYFEKINNRIMSALENLGFKNISQKGISDICIGNKKILGSSIYRKNAKVFYHAVLNLAEDVYLISKYISHPNKEPDYRMNRKHEDFVTSLSVFNPFIKIDDLKNEIIKTLNNCTA